MPAKSVAQRNLMGLAYAAKKSGKQLPGTAGKVEQSMSLKSLKDFAATPAKGLPKKAPKRK